MYHNNYITISFAIKIFLCKIIIYLVNCVFKYVYYCFIFKSNHVIIKCFI